MKFLIKMKSIITVISINVLLGFNANAQKLSVIGAMEDYKDFLLLVDSVDGFRSYIPDKGKVGLIAFERDSSDLIRYRSILIRKWLIPFFEKYLDQMQLVYCFTIDSMEYYIIEKSYPSQQLQGYFVW